MNTSEILAKARHSPFYRWLLNVALDRMVPFNKPHGLKVVEVSADHLRTLLPYRRKNLNHIKGLHACALATLSEFTTGFLLVSRLDQKKYRLIMQRLEMDYHYQGKMDAYAEFSLTDEWLEANVHAPLRSGDATVITCVVKVHDAKGNQLTTGHVYWQIKSWSKVRTTT